MSSSSSSSTQQQIVWKIEILCLGCDTLIVHKDDTEQIKRNVQYLTSPYFAKGKDEVHTTRVPRISSEKVDISQPSTPKVVYNAWFPVTKGKNPEELQRFIKCKRCGNRLGDFYFPKGTEDVEDAFLVNYMDGGKKRYGIFLSDFAVKFRYIDESGDSSE